MTAPAFELEATAPDLHYCDTCQTPDTRPITVCDVCGTASEADAPDELTRKIRLARLALRTERPELAREGASGGLCRFSDYLRTGGGGR